MGPSCDHNILCKYLGQTQYVARPLYASIARFQKTGKKPRKTRKFAPSRGLSGLIYAQDTNALGADMEGEEVSQSRPVVPSHSDGKKLAEGVKNYG